jgi:hypothetical protein
MVSIPISDPSSSNYRIMPGSGYDGIVRVIIRTVYGTGIGDRCVDCGAVPTGSMSARTLSATHERP